MAHMNSYDNFNKIILNIKDPNLKFTGLANNSQKQCITLEAIATFGKRPNCIRYGSSDVEYHGYTTNKVFCLSPDPSKPLRINLHKQRAKCLKCGKSFQKESPELVKKYKNISNQVNQRVISE